MNNVKIIPVNQDEGIKDVAALAKKIWFEHYNKIIDEGQIEYMVNKYQSKKAIKQQIELEKYQYFIAEFDRRKSRVFWDSSKRRKYLSQQAVYRPFLPAYGNRVVYYRFSLPDRQA